MDFLIFAEAHGATNPLFELFANNAINWLIMLALIVYAWNKVTPKMFDERANNINAALSEANLIKQRAETLLEENKKKVAGVENEVQQIRDEGEKLAKQLAEQMAQQTSKDIADLKLAIEQQIANEKQMAIADLRRVVAATAIKITEESLPRLLTDEVKGQLLSQFIEQLDSATSSDALKMSAKTMQSLR